MVKRIIVVIVALVIGFAGGYIASKQMIDKSQETAQGEVDSKLLSEEIIEISELATAQDTYVGEFTYNGETRKFFKTNIDIPFTKKNMTVIYEGTVKCGIDMSQFTENDISINENSNTVVVEIPQVEILSHEIDEDSYMITSKKSTILNRLTPEDDSELRKKAKKKGLKKVDIDTLMTEAEENAIKQITALLELACPDMNVSVKVIEQ